MILDKSLFYSTPLLLSIPPLLLAFALLVLFLQGYSHYLKTGPGGFGQSPIGYIRCLSPTPQRHIVHQPNEKLALKQLGFFKSLADQYPEKVSYGCSSIERIGPALFAHPDFDEERKGGSLWLRATRREIMHIHLSPFSFPTAPLPSPDLSPLPARVIRPYEPLSAPPAPQSMHILLSPVDADLVMRKKWAVRHAASGDPPRPLVSMPPGFILLYAPETDEELETFERICHASIGFSVAASPPLQGQLVDPTIYSH